MFAERLQKLKNILPKFPGSYESRNIPQEELNKILLYSVTHGCANQAMILGFDYESETLFSALEPFERMEIAEAIYEGVGSPSITKHPRADAKQASDQKGRKENPPRLQFL